jgi:hypothetical protein
MGVETGVEVDVKVDVAMTDRPRTAHLRIRVITTPPVTG